MSRRFGRSQRRKAREAVEVAERNAFAAETREVFARSCQRSADAARARAENALQRVYRSIEEIAGKHSALLPVETTEEQTNPFSMHFARLTPPALASGYDQDRVVTENMTEMVLQKLRIKAVRDEIQRGLIVSVSFPGRGEASIFMTDEAWKYATIQESLATEVARKIVRELANVK